MTYLDQLLESLYKKFNGEEREGIHVSDLTLCPRKSVFRKLNPEQCTARDLNFFTSGRAIHDSIQTLANHDSKKFEIEKEIEWEGITGHVDLFDSENNIAIECKSARIKTMDAPKPHYITQLKAYMAMLGSKTGVILIQLLMHFEDSPFVEFKITMDEEEMNTTKQKLLLDKELYISAIEKKDAMIARSVLDDPDLNWLCKSCKYLDKCCKK